MDKKKLISEDLKRYKQLLEYTFYVPEKEEDDVENLLFDGMYITEQDPAGDEEEGEEGGDDPFADAAGDETAGEEGGDDPFADTGEEGDETGGDDPFADTGEEGEEGGETDPFGTGAEVEDEVADEEEDKIEVDVTDIVDKTDETKSSVETVSDKMEELLSKLGDLESQISGMDNVIDKIDGLEKEIERRNPTPVERLEMRSMDSFPYSVKLTDFWKDKDGYQATDDEEYTLTQSDVDNFDEKEIRSSFEYEDDEDKGMD